MLKLLFLLSFFINSVNLKELFTATSDLDNIVDFQKNMTQAIEQYITLQNIQLQKLKTFSDKFQLKSEQFAQSKDMLENPINAFVNLRQMAADIKSIQNIINANNSKLHINGVIKNATAALGESDVTGAAVGLIRLQRLYELKTEDLADGIVLDAPRAPSMSAADCAQLALYVTKSRDLFIDNLTQVASEWMTLAGKKVNLLNDSSISEIGLMRQQAIMHFHNGDLVKAINVSEKILKLVHSDKVTRKNIKLYKAHLLHNETQHLVKDSSLQNESKIEAADKLRHKLLCRNAAVNILHPSSRKLSCSYRGEYYWPRLREELLHTNPEIKFFHDVITDEESYQLRSLAKRSGAMSRSRVSGGVTSPIRISKTAWLFNNDSHVVRHLSNRSEIITGLSSASAEPFQIVNYGIGGQYMPHLDFLMQAATSLRKKTISPSLRARLARGSELYRNGTGIGDRIATLLCYLSDVKLGGATVFPKLGLKISPKRNGCILWHNLLRSGVGIDETLHGGCPVLVGSKWICNIWFHEQGQEFKRPCGKQFTD